MAEKVKNNKAVKAGTSSGISWPFGTKNYIAFGIAVVVIAIGYVLLGKGSITVAPILLVLGYCVLIPVALIIKSEPKKPEQTITES